MIDDGPPFVDDEPPLPCLAELGRLDPLLAAKIEVAGEDGCWLWTGATVKSKRRPGARYGRLKRKGKYYLAHRRTWTLFYGAIPDEFEVHHLCSNTRCVNPRHLEAMHADEHNWIHRELDAMGGIARAA
jgi:hypothetical protein